MVLKLLLCIQRGTSEMYRLISKLFKVLLLIFVLWVAIVVIYTFVFGSATLCGC